MQRQKHQRLAFARADHRDPQERARRQIERLARKAPGHAQQLRRPLRFRQLPEVNDGNGQRKFRKDVLRGYAIDSGERSAQVFVAADDLVDSPNQDSLIERTIELVTVAQVVSKTVRFELVQKPKSLLVQRKRQVRGMLAAGNSFRLCGEWLFTFQPCLQQ